jgi:vacuolar protein sorting-associated protein 13A/C
VYSDNRLTEEGEDLPEAPQAQASTEVFFELLRLQPVQLDISFMRTETMNSDSACVLHFVFPPSVFV